MGRRLLMLGLCLGPLACGGAGSPSDDDRIGPVDLAQAPLTLAMTCDAGVSASLEMPCLVGLNLGSDLNAAGIHATECRLAQPDRPLVWPFLLPLADVRADPSTVLHAPFQPGGAQEAAIRGEAATMSVVTGDLSFSRVDPTARAFIGAFKGTVVWTGTSGAQTTCQVDGPFWGAPGDFL
jgi:hypothetical protein